MQKSLVPEEKVVFGHLSVYRGRGMYLRRLEQYEKAKAAFDEAYRLSPDDILLLIGRSRTCSEAVQPQQAFADAELALQLEPDNIVAANTQARAMYTMSEFEHSVVKSYRGFWRRTQPPCFSDGVSQGLETIEDCIGRNSGSVMLDFLPLIKKHEMKRVDDDEPQVRPHRSRIPHPEYKKKLTQEQTRRREIMSRVLAMKYLGPMAFDKFFVEEMLEDANVKSANVPGSEKLRVTIQESLQSLSDRQEMLRRQRPYYTIKLAERTVSHHQNLYKKAVLYQERKIARATAELMLTAIEKCLQSHRIMELIAKAERMQLFLDVKTSHTLPGKEFYIDRLYRFVGEGYLTQHRWSFRLSERGNRRRIAFLMGMPVDRPTSYDSVIANYPYKFVDIKVATEKVMENLDMCENSTMKCWLMYELARLLCTQKNYALAKFYGKRCQREAEDIQSHVWWLNGCLVLISGDMQQGNANEVKFLIDEACEWVKKLQDPEDLWAFLLKCADMVSEPVVGDDRKAILRREKQILRGMCDDTDRVDTEQLFKRISLVPPGRRMAVLPSKPQGNAHTSERRRYLQHGLTVVPGRQKPMQRPYKSGVLGLQLFD